MRDLSQEAKAVDPGESAPRGRLERWVDGYVVAWTDNDPEHIAALFTEDAVYDPQTADGEIHGVEAISDWWRGLDEDPANWDFQWLPLIETEEIGIITGTTNYYDPPTTFRNLWVIRFDDDGRCRDFTEWYIEEE
jgi:hypothetical protein